MKQFLIIIFTLSFGLANSQEIKTDNPKACECIDKLFSSSSEKPIATVYQNEQLFAFCGYSSEITKYRSDYGLLRPDSSFLLSGFVLINCATKQVVFSEGEYYTDSVKLKKDGFELYRLTYLPNPNGGKYISVPVVQFKIYQSKIGYILDTLFAIPKSYYKAGYLNKIEKNLKSLRSDSLKQMHADDLQLNYLFLRALENAENKKDFYDNSPRDGYLGPVFRDYKLYLKFKERQ